MCGDSCVEWPVFSKFVDLACYAYHFKWQLDQDDSNFDRRIHMKRITLLSAWALSNDVNLADALRLSQESLATDCRDKVYAILGLLGEGIGQHILSDYTRDPWAVYRVAVQAMLDDWKTQTNGGVEPELNEILFPASRPGQRVTRATALQCVEVARLNQYIYAMLGDDDTMVGKLPQGDIELTANCNDGSCGSRGAMIGLARLIHHRHIGEGSK